MATIRASCDFCGDLELGAADLVVRLCTTDSTGSYSFECPSCARIVVKVAEARTVDLLVAAGVPFATWELPAELLEPRGSGEAITHDELLDFHQQLADDEAVAAALVALSAR